jgi:hypothetical protein
MQWEAPGAIAAASGISDRGPCMTRALRGSGHVRDATFIPSRVLAAIVRARQELVLFSEFAIVRRHAVLSSG